MGFDDLQARIALIKNVYLFIKFRKVMFPNQSNGFLTAEEM